MSDKIRTTHVGSLVRPPRLIPYLTAILSGAAYDAGAYEKALAESVNEVVEHQAAIGLDIINDGEFGKTHWYRYAIERFSGIESRPAGIKQTYFAGKDRERFAEFYAEYDKDIPRASLEWAVTGPIAYRGAESMARDIKNLKTALTRVEGRQGFLPVVAPASLSPELINAFYPSDEAFVFAIVEALREEYELITNAGFVLQVDRSLAAGDV